MENRSTTRRKFVLCVQNKGYEVSLEQRKLYLIAAPRPNDPPAMTRVVDESGEDYLYPAGLFVPIDLPIKAKRALASA